MKNMVKFWRHPETNRFIADTKRPFTTCHEVTIQQYFAAKHPNFYVYDIETYPNVFTVTVHRISDGAVWRFEVSHRINQAVEFFQFLTSVKHSDGRMCGFNNIGFDYVVVHVLVTRGGHVSVDELFHKAHAIINTEDRFGHMVWESDWYVPQVDLFKIHHFDNVARSTSLKMLEFNMMSQNIQDLPFEPGVALADHQIDKLIPYNDHDVFETSKFAGESIPMIEFRDELSAKYGRSFTNHNDGKIGSDYFIAELEKRGIACYHRPNGRREPRQTLRQTIDLNSVILPWIQFQRPEFQRIVNWLRAQVITETKGVFKDLHCTIDGFQYDFGTGGIHGSIESQIVCSDEKYLIIDLDVASYYPNLSISNRFYPEHLGEQFCDIYHEIYMERRQFKKGTMQNAALKYALNVPYGQSNSKYSPFYDPAYTMAITINGQLLLCLLAEYLITLPGLSMVQINTDGLTVRCPRDQVDGLMFIAKTWEQLTGLELERADYSRMMIRDVNNYIAEYADGKLKRKGAYCYGDDLAWHQNFSAQIVAMAAEAALIHGKSIEQTVRNHTDIMAFMKRTKVPRSSKLMLESPGNNEQLQNITRYLVTNNGGALMKIMPPTPKQVAKARETAVSIMTKAGSEPLQATDDKSRAAAEAAGYQYSHDELGTAPDRRIGIDVGWTVTPCNNLDDLLVPPDGGSGADINFDYYIKETEKLVTPTDKRNRDMNMNKLALEIYEQNKQVGWWDDPDRCIYQTLQLVSTEIAEATEGERKNLMDDHLPHRRMGEVELADALIRVLDLAGRYNWAYTQNTDINKMLEKIESIAGKHLALNADLCKIADAIFDCIDGQGLIDHYYSSLVNGILFVGAYCEYDVMGALVEKLVYNKERQDHKRENRQTEHGKKF